MKRFTVLLVAVSFNVIAPSTITASDPPPPKIDGIVVSGPQKNLRVTPSPGADAYYFYSATNPAGPFALNPNFVLSPYVTGYSTNGLATITNLAYE